MRKPPQPIQVLVALNKSIVSRTKKLCGIFRASAEYGKLELKIMDEGRDLTPASVDHEIANGIQAFLIGANGVNPAIDHIGRLGLPMVTISQPHKTYRTVCSIHTDNQAIANEAASLLTGSKLFGSYAYYPAVGDPDWSQEREKQFLKQTARDRRKPAVVLTHGNEQSILATLPKPIGILAANDTYAKELLDLCHKAGLRVPTDVAVIGVDNEEFLCESTSPSLTSIEPDFEREGYEAVQALIRLIERKAVPPRINCGIKRIVIRKSTKDQHYADALVNRAMEYINAQATNGITVSDVCVYLKVSRRLLGLRFQEVKHTSPLEAILSRKLAALRKELATTDLPIALVCKRCGFGSENHPKKLFRERFNMTMRDYRNHAQARKHR